ncbi:MAG: imidazole glycerol phosphate synthase subunit HisH [Myxococcota bacterium]|nr:imidazole glycerol phosphate synthase subunit HisH [Myxococcota bacterium]
MASAAPRIALLDYGAGNLRSVAKALERSGLAVEVTSDRAAVVRADAVVLPGVGAFRDAREHLAAKHLDDAVLAAIAAGRPYLGLCLGLQFLFEEAEEHGVSAGLGLLRGRVTRFSDTASDGTRRLVPHIGWNEVRWRRDAGPGTAAGDAADPARPMHPMLAALPPRDHYYFVHSYRAVPADADTVVGWTDYGGAFAAAVARERIFAVQFHPEKSQTAGKRLLDAFAHWLGELR